MRIEVPISQATKKIYIEGLRDYPEPACRPHTDPTGKLAVLELDLRDVYKCAVTRVVNKQTGKQIYYQTVISETAGDDGSTGKEMLHVKCSIFGTRNHSLLSGLMANHTITKRNVLPEGFQEAKDISWSQLERQAEEPVLHVGVRQNGRLVTGELNVSPGTPLQMEIFLDEKSAPLYGLLVTHMQVTDTKSQEETIIYNGCSVDPYLFENFNTVDGDFLSAKFRAFKFPESTYVQFKGTVNVCLDKCQGVECSDGTIGYGRRRRALPELPADPNKIFEITITSFIKVGNDKSDPEELTNQKPYSNKKLFIGDQMTDIKEKTFYQTDPSQSVLELKEEKDTLIVADNSATSYAISMLSFAALIPLFV
nr:unnamed protein product [Callosobruchus chinensis]